MRRGLGSFHATRYLDDRLAGSPVARELGLCVWAEETAMTAGYIAAGVVAMIVTIYLFVALLFPERF
jgi:K+-transporting ATPase KdpF subunit